MDFRQGQRQFVTNPIWFVTVFLLAAAMRFFAEGDALSWVFWATSGVHLCNAFLLNRLVSHFRVIRQKTWLPAVFYSLLAGSHPLLMYDIRDAVILTLLLICLILFLSTYQNEHAQGVALTMAILLTVGSMGWLPLLYFVVLFWIGMLQFRSFTARTVVASLMGVALVFAGLFTYSLYLGDMSFFTAHLPDLRGLIDFQYCQFTPTEWMGVGVMLLFFLLSGSHLFSFSVSESVQSLQSLKSIFSVGLVCFAFLLLQNQWQSEWLATLCLPFAVMLARFFTLSNSRWIAVLFFLVLLFFPAFFYLCIHAKGL